MRKNNFKNTSLWFFATMTALVFFLIGGCQQEELGNMNEEKPYLYLTSDRPFEDSNDLKTLFMALKRTSLIIDNNGLYKLKQSSAREINISDELFELLVGSVNHTNKLILSKTPKISFPRLKSGEEENPGDNGNNSNIDCVAHTIYAILNSLGGNHTFSEIDNWLIENYDDYKNNGVNHTNLGDIMSHFFSNSEYQPGPPTHYDITNAGNTKTMVVLDFWDGTGHSGTLIWSDGMDALVRDDQNGVSIYCEAWRIRCRYKVTL